MQSLPSVEAVEPVLPPSTLLIRRYLRIAVGLFALLLLLNWGVKWLQPHEFHGLLLQSTTPATDFQLDTTAGQPMRLSDFRGKYVLLYFGYTFCPDVCPFTLNDLADMLKRIGPAANAVQIIFVSLDPERDTVAQLQAYLPAFHPAFLGMTGDADEILKAATQFGISYHQVGEGLGYALEHTSTVVVVDPDGYAKLVFPYGTTGEEMASDVQYLLR